MVQRHNPIADCQVSRVSRESHGFLKGHERVYTCSWILIFVKDAIFKHILIKNVYEFCLECITEWPSTSFISYNVYKILTEQPGG